MIGWLESLAAKLGSIKLPKWLTPGSPTPFEYGLRGIADALREVNPLVGALGRGLDALGANVSGGIGGLDELGASIKEIVAWLQPLAGYFGDAANGIVSAKAVVDALVPIFSGLGTIVEGVAALADAVVPAGDVAGLLDGLFAALTAVVKRLVVVAALFEMEGVEAAAAFIEAAGRITGQLKSMVDGFTAVASYVPAVIGPALDALFGQLLGTVRKLRRLAPLFEAEGVAAATAFVEAAGRITGQLKSMVDGFTAVASYVPAVIGAALDVLFGQLLGTVRKLLRLAALVEAEGVAAAATFVAAAGNITSELKGMVDGFNAVAGYEPQEIGTTLSILFDQVRQVIVEISSMALLMSHAGLAAAVELAEAAGQIVAPLKAIIDALNAVASYGQEGRVDFAARIGQLMADLQATAQGIVFGLRGFGRDVLAGLEEAAPITDALGRLVAFVRGTVEALNAVAGYGQEGRVDFAVRIGQLMADLQATAQGIVFGLRGFGRDVLAGLEGAAETTDALGRLVAFVRGGIDAITALAEYTAAQGLAAAVHAFVVDVLVVAGALQAGLGSLSDELMAAYDGAIEFGERIGRLVAVVRPGIDAITALTDYQGALGLPAAVRRFVADVLALAHELRVGLGSLSPVLLAAYDGAIEFGERIGRIVAVVQPGIAAIAAVTGYQAATDLPAAVRAFGRDVVAMASELRLAFGSLSAPLATAFDGAIEFADKIARIVAVVQPGIAAIAAVTGYTAAQGLAARVRAFAADVLLVAEELRLGLGTPSEEMLAAYEAAATWTEKITAILGLIRPAMDALQELSRYGGGAATALHAGMEKLTRNVASLINFLSSHYQVLGGEAVAQAQTFAESIVAIVTAIRRGLEEAAGIEGLSATYDGAFVVGQNWITGIVDGITSRLSDLTDLMAYIRGLFPSSPAMYGPWRDLPMGNDVAQRWLAGMTQEMRRTSELERSLAGVRGLYAGVGAGAYVPSASTGSAYGLGGGMTTVNVTMNGPFNVRQDADIEKLATAVGDVIARQASLTRRKGLARV